MSLPIKPKAQVKLEGGIQVEAGGTLCIDGWLKGDIVLNGGTLQVDDDTTIDSSSRISLLSSSILKIVTGKTLAYSGSAISVGASTLTLRGGGSFVSGGLTLNDADSKLLLNSITLDSASTSSDSLGLDVDNNSTITAFSVGHITPVSIAAGKSLSGAVTVTAGSLKLNETGTLASTIAMSGGTLDSDESSTVSGAMSHTADIEIDVATSKTLTYSGTAISLGANTITLSGGGSLVSGGLTLNDADSKLLLNSITLDSASTSADSLGLDVDNNSTITALSVGHITPVSIAAGKSLSGAITVSAGSVKLDETGTLASTIAMSGGTLDADETSTVSGALAQSGDIAIDIAAGKTLTYSGAAVDVGAKTLTLSGGGTLGNTNAFVLNNANSKLLLNSITLDSASTSVDSSGLDVNADSTVTSLSVGHITPVSIAAGKSLSGKVTLTAGSLKLNETGTLASTIGMSGGTLDADETSIVSGALTQSGDIAIDVATGKTLTYSGAAISLGAKTITLSGGGTLGNTNALVLNNANSKLLLNSITLDSVSTSADSLGLDVDNNSTITALSVGHITPVSIASNKTLSGAVTVTAGSLKLNETGTLASTIAMSGGTLDSDESSTVSGALSHTADIEIDVATSKTLTYSGSAISVGANTITLSGGGSLVSGGLTLNNADSKLLLNSITLDSASTSSDSLGLDVDADSTVTSLSVANITPVSIAAGKSLSGAITVSAGSVKLDETGTLASTIAMSGGTLDSDESSTVSGTLSHTADITIDVNTGKTLTYSGAAISLGAKTITLSGGGTLGNTNALVLNNANSKLLLNSITISSVSTSADSLGLDVVDADSTITALSVGHITPVSIAAGKSLSGAITVSAGSVKLDETGTLASTIAMSGGTLDADESSTVSGALTQSGDIALDVADNKTLTYSGAAVSLGANTLTLSGGGTLGNTNAFVLNNANSKLLLNSITLDSASTSADSLGLDIDTNSTVTSLSVSHITPVSIAAGKSLSGAITVSAGSVKLDETGTLASTIAMSGGTLDSDESSTVSGALSHTAGIEIDVATSKTLTYSGTAISLGANTITLSGGGSLVSGGLTLNDADSKLLLNSITLDSASTSADSLGLDVDNADSTITALSVGQHNTCINCSRQEFIWCNHSFGRVSKTG